jgi:hypothetical protein
MAAVLLNVTDHIKDLWSSVVFDQQTWAGLGQGKCPTHTRVGGVPLNVTDDIQG